MNPLRDQAWATTQLKAGKRIMWQGERTTGFNANGWPKDTYCYLKGNQVHIHKGKTKSNDNDHFPMHIDAFAQKEWEALWVVVGEEPGFDNFVYVITS